MRILLFTGKGGVGKTTVAAATALELSRRGRRTLVLSTDAAHSLGDSVKVALTDEPTRLAPGLEAVEVDALNENDRAWEALRGYLTELLSAREGDGLATQEALLFPGLAELFSLLRILTFVDSGDYDTLVVDCAPSGETLSLLHYPERLADFVTAALPVKRRMVRLVGRPIERLTKLPMPEDRLFDDLTMLTERLRRLGELLHDGDVTTIRLVATPEKIVVDEARRDLTWLTMYGFTVDGVVVNRVYPDEALAGYFGPWASRQASGLALLEEAFAHVPVRRLGLQAGEVVGLDALGAVASELYGPGDDPAAVGYRGSFYRLTRTGADYELAIALPGASKAEVGLQQDGRDLLLDYRGARRRLALPDAVAGRDVIRARYLDDELLLTLS